MQWEGGSGRGGEQRMEGGSLTLGEEGWEKGRGKGKDGEEEGGGGKERIGGRAGSGNRRREGREGGKGRLELPLGGEDRMGGGWEGVRDNVEPSHLFNLVILTFTDEVIVKYYLLY